MSRPAGPRAAQPRPDLRPAQSPTQRTDAAPARGVYLDYAAATPVAPEVLEAMLPYLTERFYNPSAPYALARGAREDLEAARTTLAHLVGGRPDNVTLTAGATEANNLAVSVASPGAHVVTDAIEHESVLACVEARPHAIVGVGPDGRVDPAAVARAITPETELVTIGLANGEIGTVQPLREVARVVAAERVRRLEAGEGRPIWLHTDASQAAGHLSVNVSTLGVDLMTLSAAKLYGPKQVGLLWAADGVEAARRAASARARRTSPARSASPGRSNSRRPGARRSPGASRGSLSGLAPTLRPSSRGCASRVPRSPRGAFPTSCTSPSPASRRGGS